MATLSRDSVSGADVFEFGVGTGHLTVALAQHKRVTHVTAVDVATDMIDACRERVESIASRAAHVDFLVADVEAMDLPPCDVVCSNATVQWLQNPRDLLARTAEAARPGGVLGVSAFGPRTLEELHESYRRANGADVPTLARFFAADELVSIVEQSGWEVVQTGVRH